MTGVLQPRISCQAQIGFTLLEVLVAMIVLSIGLLGLAGLQATGLQANHSAYLRSQASFLAYDMLDIMRIDRTGSQSGIYNIAMGDALATASPQAEVDAWGSRVISSLPSGDASVVSAQTMVSGLQVTQVTITIQWDDSRAGGLAQQQFIVNSQL